MRHQCGTPAAPVAVTWRCVVARHFTTVTKPRGGCSPLLARQPSVRTVHPFPAARPVDLSVVVRDDAMLRKAATAMSGTDDVLVSSGVAGSQDLRRMHPSKIKGMLDKNSVGGVDRDHARVLPRLLFAKGDARARKFSIVGPKFPRRWSVAVSERRGVAVRLAPGDPVNIVDALRSTKVARFRDADLKTLTPSERNKLLAMRWRRRARGKAAASDAFFPCGLLGFLRWLPCMSEATRRKHTAACDAPKVIRTNPRGELTTCVTSPSATTVHERLAYFDKGLERLGHWKSLPGSPFAWTPAAAGGGRKGATVALHQSLPPSVVEHIVNVGMQQHGTTTTTAGVSSPALSAPSFLPRPLTFDTTPLAAFTATRAWCPPPEPDQPLRGGASQRVARLTKGPSAVRWSREAISQLQDCVDAVQVLVGGGGSRGTRKR